MPKICSIFFIIAQDLEGPHEIILFISLSHIQKYSVKAICFFVKRNENSLYSNNNFCSIARSQNFIRSFPGLLSEFFAAKKNEENAPTQQEIVPAKTSILPGLNLLSGT